MKLSKSKKIKFLVSGFGPGSLLEHSDIPSPSKNFLPEWYKNTKNVKRDSAEKATSTNVKDCMPFLDTLMSGYIWTLPSDVYVERIPGEKPSPKINFNKDLDYISNRDPKTAGLMNVPDGCYDIHFLWKHPLHIQTPPGYSVLVTHPLNRHDLPFISLSGIVDTDMVPLRPGNYPFFIKKNFEGIIPKGTPVLQIIPIKRENWISEKDTELFKSWETNTYDVKSLLTGWYKKNFWQRKSYN